MPKTYTAAGSATAGDVYTSSAHNVIVTDVNNLIVPPAVEVYRSSNLTSYTSNTDITWNASNYDTDGMFTAPSTTVTIQTTGLYLLNFYVYLTATATITSIDPAIFLNGSGLAQGGITAPTSTSGIYHKTTIASLSATNTLTCRLTISGGSNYAINGGSVTSGLTSRFTATWIGRIS